MSNQTHVRICDKCHLPIGNIHDYVYYGRENYCKCAEKEITMQQNDLDEFYHLLRKLSNDRSDNGILQLGIVKGLARHILDGGDYLALVQWSEYYGTNYLLKPSFQILIKNGIQPKRIIDIGAGLGWLGRGLQLKYSQKLNYLPLLKTIDKRNWTAIDTIANMEDDTDRQKVISSLVDGDLVVMCDFLHCTTNPDVILDDLRKYDTLILEYMSLIGDYRDSYFKQLSRYGATSFGSDQLSSIISKGFRKATAVNADGQYILALLGKEY